MIELSQVSPWLFVLAPIVIVAAYTLFGLTGFGSTLISVPILAHFLPVAYLVPLMVLMDMVCAAVIGTKGREQVSKAELKNLVPFMFLGFLLGATLLVGIPDKWLRLAIGVFAASLGVYSILNPVFSRTISRLWCVPAGIVAGAAATVFGAGGPIYAAYLAGRLHDKGEIRATVSSLISISAFTRALIYAAAGLLLHAAIFFGMLVLAPFAWLGVYCGGRIHVGLTHIQLRRVVGAILVITGSSLVLRAILQA